MITVRTIIATAAFAGFVSAAIPALAADEYNVSTGTTLSGAGVALRGDDVVALATGLEVAAGYAKYTVERDGVAYYFASEETMKQFAADPERYLPQFGGFCAFGVAIGKKLDAAPRYADIVDGKLYVFLNAVAFAKYKEDKAGTLAKAERNWPAMHHLPVEEVNGGV
ncbi:MAG: YHS domain-containing protein [Rhodobiaceae bacterium]|nr:YHS domain-containing protein [Rhodobiaceae bacterium]